LSILTDSTKKYITVAKGPEKTDHTTDQGILIFENEDAGNNYKLYSFVDKLGRDGISDHIIIDEKRINLPEDSYYQYLFNVTGAPIKNISKKLGNNNDRVYATILSSACVSKKIIRYASYATLKKI
jgi:hypothetical protein